PSLDRGTHPKAQIRAKSGFLHAEEARSDRVSTSGRRQGNAHMGLNSKLPMGGTAGPTVLVVEDDPSLRMLCRVNLELEHYRVLEAETLTRAEELVRTEHPDVVLLDLHVGDRHGLELLPIPREEGPKAGVCLLSGTS